MDRAHLTGRKNKDVEHNPVRLWNLFFDNLIYRFWHGDGDRSREYYYLFDGLGSVIALTDADGDTVETYRYDVYGKPQILDNTRTVITVSAVGNNYMFTARRYDPETKLYHYRARMYNPTIGKFLQTDPVGYADGLNWYAYCGNNPITSVDPMGLWDFSFGIGYGLAGKVL